MISFKLKTFSEYDAMRQLYVELMKLGASRDKFKIIDTSALIPILRGNNVVIEKFTQATRVFGRDRYRMYLKIGAKAKLPDDVRLPQFCYDKELGKLDLSFNSSIGSPQDNNQNNNNQNQNKKNGNKKEKKFSLSEKIFAQPNFSVTFRPGNMLKYTITRLLGDAIRYNKKERSLVLEFDSIRDAIAALNILPFGLNYNIYLLNA